MENNEFDFIMQSISAHLKREKVFVPNPGRMKDVVYAMQVAKILFPDHVTEIKNDPLHTGALILQIDCTDVDASMVVDSQKNIALFNEMVALANNFEFYKANGNIRFAVVFNGALNLIK